MVGHVRTRAAIWGLILLIIVVPLFGGTAVARSNKADELKPLADIDIWVDPLGAYHFWYSGCKSGDRIYGDFEVTSGAGIDFFICDQENWDLWDTGHTASVYQKHDNWGSLTWDFTVPEAGTWHVVFDNMDSLFTSKHIVGHIYHVVPTTTSSYAPLDISGFFPGILVLAIIVVIVALSQRSMKQKSGMKPTEPPPMTSSVQQAQAGFCPFCGAPRLALNAAFCSHCGRQYPTGPGVQ
jgi:hypothetical protein